VKISGAEPAILAGLSEDPAGARPSPNTPSTA